MAVTGAIFNSLSFGGVNSADYGIYITGEGVFNAPKRAVNMVAVPGRNGSIAIDQGHWDNIEVTYPAGMFGMDEEEFRKALSNFRNAIASQVGYQRLTDTYHPDEYRMAIYMDGLEVEPTTYNKAGEFELKFNCKPQRWLTAGEVPVTIGEWGATKTASGEIVTIESEGGEAAKSLVVELEPIQSGSGEPSPDNVRPISGRTEVVTSVAGKNLLPMTLASLKAVNTGATWSGNTYTRNGITFTVLTDSADNVIGIRANGTATAETTFYQINNTKLPLASGQYAFNGCPSGGSDTTYRMQLRNGSAWLGETGNGRTFTYDASTSGADLVRIDILNGATCNNVVFKPMIRLATDTDATFEPYQGASWTTSLGRTVYGGTLDVVSGELIVNTAYRTFNGSENWEKINQGFRLAGGFGGKTYSTKDVSNMLTYATSDPTLNPNSYKFTVGGFLNVGVPYTVAEWKSLLATTNLQVVYELATPQTYQLTPQQIELLLGENHLWSDGSITMQYGDDPNSLWNPTRYDAGPLLAVKGHGDVSFNGYTVAIDAGEYGLINVKGTKILSDPITYSTKTELYNSGDTIEIYLELQWGLISARSPRATRVSNLQNTGDGQTETQPFSNGSLKGTTIIDTFFLSSQDTTLTNVFSCDVEFSNGHTATTTLTLEVVWDSANSTLSFHTTPSGHGRWGRVIRTYPTSIIEAVSSKTYLGDPTYVDCELGEAYKIEDGEIVSLNKYIELGSDLPKLSSGANDVTISNTVTELKVTPNWWKL